MADTVITPKGPDAIQLGTLIDNDGQRLCVMRFETERGDTLAVALRVPLFQQLAALAADLAVEVASPEYWADHD